MKYRDENGNYQDIYVKAMDTVPIGAEVDYIGNTVPAGWTQIDSYSTDEINTGQTWINGKPIYRKVIDYVPEATMGATSTTTHVQIAHNISNFGQLIHAWCVSEINNMFPVTSSTNGTVVNSATGIHHVSTTDIIFSIINDTWGVRHYYFVVEYTKTTD